MPYSFVRRISQTAASGQKPSPSGLVLEPACRKRAERPDAKVRNREEGARFGLALQGTAVAGSRTYICARMPCFGAFCAARALPSGVRARLTSRRSCGWPPRAHWTRTRRRGRLPDRVERRRTGWGRTGGRRLGNGAPTPFRPATGPKPRSDRPILHWTWRNSLAEGAGWRVVLDSRARGARRQAAAVYSNIGI